MNLALRIALGTVAVTALAGGCWYAYTSANAQPVMSVGFTGESDRIAREDLDKLAEAIRAMPPGAATLSNVREAARKLPWVRDASARRRFPDGMEVQLDAYEAMARWNDGFLVSPDGEVFPGRSADKLPKFLGPDGSAAEMTHQYTGIAKALAPLGSPIEELRLSPRGAWQVGLESGLVLELGRGDVVARIERFAAAWPQLVQGAPRYADLRYPNGFALKRPAEAPAPKTASKTKKA
ncbi:Cell division protein FtsQ [Usitatibacter rugosus]|uniref:Cell division protein FtsQ n=1 Tax=Usitatibacter rugosus TaxID=2732067 RepID=A0A6M4GTK4_9PROT|nr:cell division protein FtsQ/DivIB [Usitatibacter rugosus]QJR09633.1 Cell division protein FtsQ [Usitatibacter rugosus]